MALIKSSDSGSWNDTATWVGGIIPTAVDTWEIQPTHIVIVDAELTANPLDGEVDGNAVLEIAFVMSTSTFADITVDAGGQIYASRTVSSTLVASGLIQVTGTDALNYGTDVDPISDNSINAAIQAAGVKIIGSSSAVTPKPASYGTASGVAAYSGIFTDAGKFTSQTNPTEVTVVNWIDQISAYLNAAMISYGVNAPILENLFDSTDRANMVRPMCVALVEQDVADLVALANGSGRLVPIDQRGISPWKVIRNEIFAWAQQMAPGLIVEIGKGDQPNLFDQIGYDNNPDVHPIFQNKAFGNRFRDWSKYPGSSTEETTPYTPDTTE
jgi:hypothetical protein